MTEEVSVHEQLIQRQMEEAEKIAEDWAKFPGAFANLGKNQNDFVLRAVGAITTCLQKYLLEAGAEHGLLIVRSRTERPYVMVEGTLREKREAELMDSHIKTRLRVRDNVSEWVWEAFVWTVIEKAYSYYPFLFSKFKVYQDSADSIRLTLKVE